MHSCPKPQHFSWVEVWTWINLKPWILFFFTHSAEDFQLWLGSPSCCVTHFHPDFSRQTDSFIFHYEWRRAFQPIICTGLICLVVCSDVTLLCLCCLHAFFCYFYCNKKNKRGLGNLRCSCCTFPEHCDVWLWSELAGKGCQTSWMFSNCKWFISIKMYSALSVNGITGFPRLLLYNHCRCLSFL